MAVFVARLTAIGIFGGAVGRVAREFARLGDTTVLAWRVVALCVLLYALYRALLAFRLRREGIYVQGSVDAIEEYSLPDGGNALQASVSFLPANGRRVSLTTYPSKSARIGDPATVRHLPGRPEICEVPGEHAYAAVFLAVIACLFLFGG